MEDLSNVVPKIERLDNASEQDVMLRRTVAEQMRQSPALRSLADIVRSDPEIYDAVAGFVTRREEFKDGYDRPGRSVAPWFAGVARHAPDMLDTALEEHFRTNSEEVEDNLQDEVSERGYAYRPLLVIGTGPQSQILVSGVMSEKPEYTNGTLVIDKASSVGGVFREDDGMNFRLNSRTRPQTDKDPIPGTVGNINILKPGVMTLADMTTEIYAPANELGRTVRINHALNGADIGLGMELVAIMPDFVPSRDENMPGNTSVVVRNNRGDEFVIRTDLLVATTGGGEPKLSRFDSDTQKLIYDQKAQYEAGEKPPRVMLYADFYRMLKNNQFPFKDVKDVAVVGAGDSGRTAVGTILGYEPRPDGSVIQLDYVKNLRWYGQSATNDRTFAESNRLRYAQAALELPRSANPDRAYRITPDRSKIERIDWNEETDKPVIAGNEFDLVVVATGFEGTGEDWITSKVREPITVLDQKVQDAFDPEGVGFLDVGDTIIFPNGYNISKIQVLEVTNKKFGGLYIAAIETSDGQVKIGQVSGRKREQFDVVNLADYCSIENFDSRSKDQIIY